MADDRLTELEIRYAFQEDTLAQLNEVLVAQQKQVDQLTERVAFLEEIVKPAADDDGSGNG